MSSHARAHGSLHSPRPSSPPPPCPLLPSAYPFSHFYADFTRYAQACVDCYTSHSSQISLYLQANRSPPSHPHPAEGLARIIEGVGKVDGRTWRAIMRDTVLPWLHQQWDIATCQVLPPLPPNVKPDEVEGAERGPRTGVELWQVLKGRLRKDFLVKTLSVQRQFFMLWEKHKVLRRGREEEEQSDQSEDEEEEWDDDSEEGEEERSCAARALLERATALHEHRQMDAGVDTAGVDSTDSEPPSPSSHSSDYERGRERLVRQCVGACRSTSLPSPSTSPLSPSTSPLSPPMSPSAFSSLLLSTTRHETLPRSESTSHFHRKPTSSPSLFPHHPNSLQPHPHPHRRRRNPIIVFLGGGMSAGKSTVLSHLRSLRTGLFGIHSDAVYIESDHFKGVDPVYVGLRDDDPDRAGYVHGYSVRVAEEALLSAVRARRDVVIDGTCAWRSYVEQTIRMIRRSEEVAWKRGEGMREDGTEEYWVEEPSAPLPWALMAGQEEVKRIPSASSTTELSAKALLEQFPALAYSHTPLSHLSAGGGGGNGMVHSASTTSLLPPPPPYLIAMLGVTTPVPTAISRAIRRAVITGRTVPLQGLKRSYELFSAAYESYIKMVDAYLLYENSVDEMMILPQEFIGSGGEERKESGNGGTLGSGGREGSGSVLPHPVLLASKQFDAVEGVVHNPELYQRFLEQGKPSSHAHPAPTPTPPTTPMTETLQLLLRSAVEPDDDTIPTP